MAVLLPFLILASATAGDRLTSPSWLLVTQVASLGGHYVNCILPLVHAPLPAAFEP